MGMIINSLKSPSTLSLMCSICYREVLPLILSCLEACNRLSNTINVERNAAFATQPDTVETNLGCHEDGT